MFPKKIKKSITKIQKQPIIVKTNSQTETNNDNRNVTTGSK